MWLCLFSLATQADGEYVATMKAPEGGQWTAFFIQVMVEVTSAIRTVIVYYYFLFFI